MKYLLDIDSQLQYRARAFGKMDDQLMQQRFGAPLVIHHSRILRLPKMEQLIRYDISWTRSWPRDRKRPSRCPWTRPRLNSSHYLLWHNVVHQMSYNSFRYHEMERCKSRRKEFPTRRLALSDPVKMKGGSFTRYFVLLSFSFPLSTCKKKNKLTLSVPLKRQNVRILIESFDAFSGSLPMT